MNHEVENLQVIPLSRAFTGPEGKQATAVFLLAHIPAGPQTNSEALTTLAQLPHRFLWLLKSECVSDQACSHGPKTSP